MRQWCHKTTFNEALLVPIYVDEALPGDTFNLQASFMCRLATPFVPVMDNLFLDSFFFFVPNRLIWEHWENFMGANTPNFNSSTSYTIPQVELAGGEVVTADLADYMGIPIKTTHLNFNSLHMRGYQLIWDEWFRDENLQNTVFNNGGATNGDGPDAYADYSSTTSGYSVQGVLIRGKRHDYFTSSLPWPQKGPAVELPLGQSAPVEGLGTAATGGSFPSSSATYNVTGGTTSTFANAYQTQGGGSGDNLIGVQEDPSNPGYPLIYADLSHATAATINQLRQAFQIQKMYERDARGGTRYTEILRAHFGVISPDARLQRPEYLGGTSVPLIINPVVQTSGSGATGETTVQGNLAAFGVGHSHGNGFVKSFVEHGVVIGLVNVRSSMTYQQGMNKMWSRQTRLDYYWPELSHIGEQAVLNQEIYAQGLNVIDGATGNPYDTEVFGYQERYAEYRYYPSMITGQFRSTATDPLDIWHLGFDFTSLPTLSDTFINDAPPVARIVAVDDEPHFIFDSVFKNICARPMPTYGVPGLIDHF